MTVQELINKLSECQDMGAEVFVQKDENSPLISVKLVTVNNIKKRVRIVGKEAVTWIPSRSPLSLL